MANDILNPYPESKPKVAGSVFVNNTSYSGCDIKVVINLFGSYKATENTVKTLQVKLLNLASKIDNLERSHAKASKLLDGAKSSTQEFYRRSRTVNKLTSDIEKNKKAYIDTDKAFTKEVSKGSAADATTKVLAECQTISLSTYRDKQAVRSFGTVYPRGFCRGPRQIAGSLIFTVFNEHVLSRFLEAHATDFDGINFSSALMDQLPPVDITIAFANEYGALSRMAILGVEFMSEGQTMSIEDLLTENVVNFVARDYDPMRSVSQRKIDSYGNLTSQFQAKKASDLIFEDDYQDIKKSSSPFQRFSNRRNPFL